MPSELVGNLYVGVLRVMQIWHSPGRSGTAMPYRQHSGQRVLDFSVLRGLMPEGLIRGSRME
jgi:hypothetical protein